MTRRRVARWEEKRKEERVGGICKMGHRESRRINTICDISVTRQLKICYLIIADEQGRHTAVAKLQDCAQRTSVREASWV